MSETSVFLAYRNIVEINLDNPIYCVPRIIDPDFIVTQFLSIMYFTNSFSPFSFINPMPNLRFVRVINCPNRIMFGLYNLQFFTEVNLLQSAHEL